MSIELKIKEIQDLSNKYNHLHHNDLYDYLYENHRDLVISLY